MLWFIFCFSRWVFMLWYDFLMLHRAKDIPCPRWAKTTLRTSTWTETSRIWRLLFTTGADKRATAPTTSQSQTITGLVRYSMNLHPYVSRHLMLLCSTSLPTNHVKPHRLLSTSSLVRRRSRRRRTPSWNGSAPSRLCSLPASMAGTWWCPTPTTCPNTRWSTTCSPQRRTTRWARRFKRITPTVERWFNGTLHLTRKSGVGVWNDELTALQLWVVEILALLANTKLIVCMRKQEKSRTIPLI